MHKLTERHIIGAMLLVFAIIFAEFRTTQTGTVSYVIAQYGFVATWCMAAYSAILSAIMFLVKVKPKVYPFATLPPLTYMVMGVYWVTSTPTAPYSAYLLPLASLIAILGMTVLRLRAMERRDHLDDTIYNRPDMA